MLVFLVRPAGAAGAHTSMLHAPFEDDTCVRSPPAPSLPLRQRAFPQRLYRAGSPRKTQPTARRGARHTGGPLCARGVGHVWRAPLRAGVGQARPRACRFAAAPQPLRGRKTGPQRQLLAARQSLGARGLVKRASANSLPQDNP